MRDPAISISLRDFTVTWDGRRAPWDYYLDRPLDPATNKEAYRNAGLAHLIPGTPEEQALKDMARFCGLGRRISR